jgi:hypothetical protein
MAINEEETRRLFDRMAVQLRQVGAGSLVDQVIDEISQGKQIVYKTVSSRRESGRLQRAEADELWTKGDSRREYAETLQYSSRERLELLFQAIDRAIFDPVHIDAELVERFGRVRFVPEQEEERVRSFEAGFLAPQTAATEKLRSLIANFREAIGE